MTRRQKVMRTLLILGALVALAIALERLLGHYVTTDAIDQLLTRAGPWALAVYLAACVVLPILMVPAFVLWVAGGLFFGPWQGALLGHLGATGSAMASFYLARWLGRPFVARVLHGGSKWSRLDSLLQEHGFTTILSIRLMPFSPFEVTSYLSGVTAIKPGHFFWGTLVGNLPPTVAFTYLGSTLDERSTGQWVLAGGLMLVAAALPWIFTRRRARAGARDGTH